MAEPSITRRDESKDRSAHISAATLGRFGRARTATGAASLSVSVITILSLMGLTAAELITVFVDPGWGAFSHAVLAGTEITLASLAAYRGTAEDAILGVSLKLEANIFVAFALPSLLRLITLAMPRDELSLPASDGGVTLCLLALIWAAMRATGYSLRAARPPVRWSWPRLRLDLLVAGTGVIIGQVQYHILQPEGFIDGLAMDRVVIATLFVLAVAGISEELMLRGVIQVAGTALFGSAVGIAYAAAVFAVLNIGYRSWPEVGFAIAMAVWLGLAVRITGSLVGASLAHAIANVCLFVTFPLVLG